MSSVTVAPSPVVTIGGVALGADASCALLAARVQQRLDCPALAELTFTTPVELTPGGVMAVVGRPVTLSVPGVAEPLFTGEVTAVERVYPAGGVPELRVRAEDGLHRLRDGLTLAAYSVTTPAGVLRELAGRHGLSVDASTPDVSALAPAATSAPLLPHHRSDLDLLIDVARRAGLHVVVACGHVRLVGPCGAGEPIPLSWGEELIDVSVDARARRAGVSAAVYGWDAVSAGGWETTAEPPSVEALAPPAARSLAERPGSRRRVALGAAFADEASLGGAARVAAAAIASDALVLRGVALGDHRLGAGRLVVVAGLDPEVSGRYVLTAATHRFDGATGYRTEITTEPAPPPTAPTPVFAVGEIVRVDDPAGAGRVRVTLPGHGRLETGWLPVVAPGAGKGKGVVALPAAGDRVFVAVPAADPAQAVVLGGLWGPVGPPAAGGHDATAQCLAVTSAAGHAVIVDDTNDTVGLEHAGGSRIELTADGVVVHAARDLVLEAPGRTLTLRAAAIEFERG